MITVWIHHWCRFLFLCYPPSFDLQNFPLALGWPCELHLLIPEFHCICNIWRNITTDHTLPFDYRKDGKRNLTITQVNSKCGTFWTRYHWQLDSLTICDIFLVCAGIKTNNLPLFKECFAIYKILSHRCGFPCEVCSLKITRTINSIVSCLQIICRVFNTLSRLLVSLRACSVLRCFKQLVMFYLLCLVLSTSCIFWCLEQHIILFGAYSEILSEKMGQSKWYSPKDHTDINTPFRHLCPSQLSTEKHQTAVLLWKPTSYN